MAGMRDRLIHDYLGVDYFIVFDVARRMAQPLADRMEGILRNEKTRGPTDHRPPPADLHE